MSRLILIVDDEKAILESLSAALRDEGYRTSTASSGEQAIDKIRSERPDVILLDIWMPGIDGLETLQRVKAEWPEQMVLVMSGHGTIETAVKAVKMGAYDFVEKPPSLEKLLVLIGNAISFQSLSRGTC